MTPQSVRTSSEGRVTRIRLDRADADNRITVAMMRELIDALSTAEKSDSDIVVISGAGENFSVGRDQKESLPEGMTKRDSLALILEANELLAALPGITVTCARGRAMGFGSGLIVQSDLSVVADTAVLGFDEVRHGFPPVIVMTYLERFVGPKRALDLVVTGRSVPAAEALQYGMVSRVVPGDELTGYTDQLVANLLGHDRNALRGCKRHLREMRDIEPETRPGHALDQLAGKP